MTEQQPSVRIMFCVNRELRKVPPDWEHPRNENGQHISLFDHYEDALASWEKSPERNCEDERPNPDDYMLVGVPESERTHYQAYQTTSEGTPISPVLATPEEVARWCADHKVGTFASTPASYEKWLAIFMGSSSLVPLEETRKGEGK